jgi:hypothetical protein
VQDDAPYKDDDPAGHFEHLFAPVVFVYVPASHSAQSSDVNLG